MAQDTPRTRRRPPRWVFQNVINPLTGLILRSPLHALLSGRLVLLSYTGHKSGKQFTTPVGYALADDGVLLQTASAWKKNFARPTNVRVRLRGREYTGVAQAIVDEAGLVDAYRQILRTAPGYASVMGVKAGPDGQPDRDSIEQARQAGNVVIRVRFDPALPAG